VLRREFGPAIICQTIHALAGKKVSHTTWMPSWVEKKSEDAPWEELLAKTKVLHAAYGGLQ